MPGFSGRAAEYRGGVPAWRARRRTRRARGCSFRRPSGAGRTSASANRHRSFLRAGHSNNEESLHGAGSAPGYGTWCPDRSRFRVGRRLSHAGRKMSDHPQNGYRSHYRTLAAGTTAGWNGDWKIGRWAITVAGWSGGGSRSTRFGILFDQLFHPDRIGLSMAMTFDGAGSAGGLDIHVREHQVRINPHGRDVRHVHRVLEAAEPFGRVMDHARW